MISRRNLAWLFAVVATAAKAIPFVNKLDWLPGDEASKIVFYTTPPPNSLSIWPEPVERMRITAAGECLLRDQVTGEMRRVGFRDEEEVKQVVQECMRFDKPLPWMQQPIAWLGA